MMMMMLVLLSITLMIDRASRHQHNNNFCDDIFPFYAYISRYKAFSATIGSKSLEHEILSEQYFILYVGTAIISRHRRFQRWVAPKICLKCSAGDFSPVRRSRQNDSVRFSVKQSYIGGDVEKWPRRHGLVQRIARHTDGILTRGCFYATRRGTNCGVGVLIF